MNSFLVLGKDCVRWNHEESGNRVYLHMQQTRKPVIENRPLKKPMLLAIDVYIDVPDVIDISHMRSKGLQSGKELLSFTRDSEKVEKPSDNEDVSQLAIMGFDYLHCQKAAINTSNAAVKEPMN